MSGLVSLADARERIGAALDLSRPCGRRGVETVPLASVVGRVLASDILADGPWPATDRSAMDGFGVAFSTDTAANGTRSGQTWPVVGESLAGHPYPGTVPVGQAVRIMTGAVVPGGVDAVVPVEHTDGYDGDSVTVDCEVQQSANIRRAGSEVQEGACLLRAGTLLGSAEVGALAVLGIVQVQVMPRPVVAVVATGDEVVPIEQTPEPHQLRNSNTPALQAWIEAAGGEARSYGIAPDEPVALRALLERAIAEADVVLTIGGISKGTHDLVHATLAELGVEANFHGVALKPGKPTFFGVRTKGSGEAVQSTFVFGLPGNPASCVTCFKLFVEPMLVELPRRVGAAIDGARGREVYAAAPLVAKRTGAAFRANFRLQAVPARLIQSADGALEVAVLPVRPSGDPFTLLDANAFALVPPEQSSEDVDQLAVLPFAAQSCFAGPAGAQ